MKSLPTQKVLHFSNVEHYQAEAYVFDCLYRSLNTLHGVMIVRVILSTIMFWYNGIWEHQVTTAASWRVQVTRVSSKAWEDNIID